MSDGGDKATANGFEAKAEMVAGVATSSSERASFWIGCDSEISPYPSDTDLSTSAVIRSLTTGTPTLDAQADFVSMNSDGFTINWSTADSTQRKIGWIALGPAQPPVTATKLVFTVEPTNTAAESTFLPAIKVEAQDDLGVTDTNYTANISIAILNNPPSNGILSGTTTVAAVNGVATFSDLSIDKVGVGYTLQATSGSLTAATSVSFNITAIKLVFTVQPTNTASDATITPAIEVAAQDNYGNTDTTYTADISMAILNNPLGTGALSGTTPVAAVSGVATFSDLSIDKAGVGYTLQATAVSLTSATSTSFNITASKLVFTVQPSNTRAGATITPAIEVAAQDNYGNTDTTYTANVSIAILNNPPTDGILSGTTPVAAVSGVATFSDLSIDKAGAGYTLQATATGLTSGTSTSFNITSATKLVFTVQPTNTKAEATIAAITVEAQDDLGTTDTIYDEDISIAILNNPPSDGILSGTTPVAAVNGVATFSDLSIDKVGAGYTLQATSGSLTAATSVSFNITAIKLVFTVQPTNTEPGATITPAIEVAAQDNYGNTDTTYTANVSIAILNNPGSGTLSGTTPVAAVNGVATFSDLSIDNEGNGYTLQATATGLTSATSTSFNISLVTATKLVFTVEPSDTVEGNTIIPAIKVEAQDDLGTTDPNYTTDIVIAILNNPPTDGILSGTTTISPSAGVATFNDLSIDKAGTGYTLQVTSGSLTAATSASFNITPPIAISVTMEGSTIVIDDETRTWKFMDDMVWGPKEWYHDNVGSGADNLVSTNAPFLWGIEGQGNPTDPPVLLESSSTRARVMIKDSNDPSNYTITTIYPDGKLYQEYNVDYGSDIQAYAVHRPAAAAPQVSDRDESNNTVVFSDTLNNNYAGISLIPYTSSMGVTGSLTLNDNAGSDEHAYEKTAGLTGSGQILVDASNYRATTVTRDNTRDDYRNPSSLDTFNSGSGGWFDSSENTLGNWWDSSYTYRRQLTIGSAASGYSIKLALSGATASDIYGKSLSSGNDFRVVWWNGSGWTELDRYLVSFSSSDITVYFKIQEVGGWGGGTSNYYLYYGNTSPGSPPADGANVFLFYDDGFESGLVPPWDTTYADTGDSITQSSTRAYAGTYSAKAETDNQTGATAYVQEDITGQSTLYIRMYIYLDSGFDAWPPDATDEYVNFLRTVNMDSGWQNLISLNVYSNDDAGESEYMKLYFWNTWTSEAYWSTNKITTGQWHSIEVKLVIAPAPNGEAKMWLDGNLEINQTGINTGTLNITRICSGITWQGNYTDPHIIYIDEHFFRTGVDPEPTTSAGNEETSSSSDFFNEAEGVYAIDMADDQKLVFDIHGETYNRYSPAFKIRNYRSLDDPGAVYKDSTLLVKGSDYALGVIPFSEAWYSTGSTPNPPWWNSLYDYRKKNRSQQDPRRYRAATP
jgi:hypothetical protein